MIALRDFVPQDAAFIVNTLNDEQVIRFLSPKIPFPYTQSDAQWWITHGAQKGIVKAITVKNQLAGCIGVMPGEFEYCRSGEIGYWLNKNFWGQGIMTKAMTLIVKNVFSHSEITRIHGAVFSGNTGSMNVLIKSGFNAEAILKNAIYKNSQFYDSHIFSLLKEE